MRALVTGGGKRLGRAMALYLARRGYDVAVHFASSRAEAEAVVAARKTLVEGAVGMVEMALEMLSAKKVVELDDERRAAMVSNLMVVLCGERDTQPVVNTGTLYS